MASLIYLFCELVFASFFLLAFATKYVCTRPACTVCLLGHTLTSLGFRLPALLCALEKAANEGATEGADVTPFAIRCTLATSCAWVEALNFGSGGCHKVARPALRLLHTHKHTHTAMDSNPSIFSQALGSVWFINVLHLGLHRWDCRRLPVDQNRPGAKKVYARCARRSFPLGHSYFHTSRRQGMPSFATVRLCGMC